MFITFVEAYMLILYPLKELRKEDIKLLKNVFTALYIHSRL